MAEPENHTLALLRRIDQKLDAQGERLARVEDASARCPTS